MRQVEVANSFRKIAPEALGEYDEIENLVRLLIWCSVYGYMSAHAIHRFHAIDIMAHQQPCTTYNNNNDNNIKRIPASPTGSLDTKNIQVQPLQLCRQFLVQRLPNWMAMDIVGILSFQSQVILKRCQQDFLLISKPSRNDSENIGLQDNFIPRNLLGTIVLSVTSSILVQ